MARAALILAALWASPLAAETPAPLTIIDGAIPAPLTARPGDAARGLALVRDPARASCLICHRMPIADEPSQGSIGPDLAGVASRYTIPELRLRLVDARMLNPDTVMPPYHSTQGLARVGAEYRGRTIYSGQEVEDVLAFLATLRAP